jgi:hypothetical protein
MKASITLKFMRPSRRRRNPEAGIKPQRTPGAQQAWQPACPEWRNLRRRQANMANGALVAEMLDLIVNDSENLERTMNLLTADAVWVLEPGGIEYHGAREIRPATPTPGPHHLATSR